jgi:hypothetical protein
MLFGNFIEANATNVVNIIMLKLLPEYRPNLNYEIKSGRKFIMEKIIRMNPLALTVFMCSTDVVACFKKTLN